jgi:hypothetical protein
MDGTSTMLQAAKLWEKTSAAGNTYLVGRLGGVRILILRNRDAGTGDEPDWHLFFTEPPSAASTSSAPRPKKKTSRPQRHGLYAAPRRPGSGSDVPNDDVSDLWPEGAP